MQAILVRLPGRLKIMMPRIFWKGVCRILGIRIRVIGHSAGGVRTARDVREGKRPVVFVANHCSWLDIAIIGSTLPVVFVAKGEVGKWPLIGTVSRLGRTIFVSRNRQETGRELHDMAARLWDGDDIVLFPKARLRTARASCRSCPRSLPSPNPAAWNRSACPGSACSDPARLRRL